MGNSSVWQRAASFAARAHMGQLRKDETTPYIAHPFRVAMVIRHVFDCDDEVAIAAAMLHDTIEDTPVDYDDIAKAFGDAVADAVAAMSKNMVMPETQREADYDARLAAGPWQGRLIKLADVYDNTTDLAPDKSMADRLRVRRARAIELAQNDADMPVFARAISAVRALD